MASKTLGIICLIAASYLSSTSASAGLISRLNGAAYYDDVLNLTWLANPNLAVTESFGVTGIDTDGLMNWDVAKQWVSAMNSTRYLGYDDWRLPKVDVDNDNAIVDCNLGSNCIDNEFGHMYYFNGVKEGMPGGFSPLFFSYWSDNEVGTEGIFAYRYYTDTGSTVYEFKDVLMAAWAVRSGDVTYVPLPAAAGLFAAGLLGLAGISKRRRS